MSKINDPKPEILRIEELVQQVKSGDIKLPKFQRPFVWNKSDILNLLDSIYKGYPIGSILLWLTKEHLASEKKIGDLEINERSEEYPTNYLLDGQQRLSSLCGALYWDGKDKKSNWNICFDLEKEVFLYPRDGYKIEYFPLNKLLGTFDFINQCKIFQTQPHKDKYEKNAQKLLRSIKDYKIAAVRIGDMKINEVSPIFERINSTGRQLTIVDLMRAATWSGGFDLNDTIDSVRKSLYTKNFDSVPESQILRNLAASNGYGIHKEGINKLRDCSPEKLTQTAENTIKAYKYAVDFITDELKITSYNYLPYGLQLTLLVEFFRLCSTPNNYQRNCIKKWFWKTAVTGYFASYNTGQLTRDLDQIRKFATNEIRNLDIQKNIDLKAFAKDDFRLNKASSKTFALLLAQSSPRSLLDGSAINTYSALSVINRHEFHHIFPKAYLKTCKQNEKQINMHANICMLISGNNKVISDTKPSIYFKKLEELLGDDLYNVLSSNLITKEAYEAGLEDNYISFVEIRTKTIIEAYKQLV